MKTVLVACPQHSSKGYCFQQWIDAVNAFAYTGHTVRVVDNSADPGFFHAWNHKVRMEYLPAEGNSNLRIAASMERIRRIALDGEFDFWLNLESDVIAPPDLIETMLEYAENFRDWGFLTETSFVEHDGWADWLAVPYRSRVTDDWIRGAFGCTLFSRGLLQAISFERAPVNNSADGWLRYSVVTPLHQFNLVDLLEGTIALQHLKDPNPAPVW